MTTNQAVLMFNRKTRAFGIADSPDIASAMIAIGEKDGFDSAFHNPPAESVVTFQTIKGKTFLILDLPGGDRLQNICGRVAAKQLAKRLRESFGFRVFNIPANGKRVECFA